MTTRSIRGKLELSVGLWIVLSSATVWAQDIDKPAADPVAPSSADEKPAEPPKRDDFILKPGAPRPKLENFRDNDVRAVKPPSQGTNRLRDALTNGGDDALIDEYAKFHALSITRRGGEGDRIVINTLGQVGDRGNPESVRRYKTGLVKFLGEAMKDNSVLVQVNALHIASEIQNGVNDVNDAIPLFLSVLNDEAASDGALYMALKGLIRGKERSLVRADEETQAIRKILERLQAKDMQSVLKAKYFETLGTLQRAFATRPADAQVATVAAQVALDPNERINVRGEAAKALGHLNLDSVGNWNSMLQAQVLARAMLACLSEELPAEADATKAADTRRYQIALWGRALLASVDQRVNKGSPEYVEFARAIALDQVLIPGLSVASIDLGPIEEWIEKHPVDDNQKFTPMAQAISFPKPPPAEEGTEETKEEPEAAEE